MPGKDKWVKNNGTMAAFRDFLAKVAEIQVLNGNFQCMTSSMKGSIQFVKINQIELIVWVEFIVKGNVIATHLTIRNVS
jgi:hypothetical protein